MAKITINEISKNYTYSTGNSSFCSVALPITASWGPAYQFVHDPDAETEAKLKKEMLEKTVFNHFPATQEGLEAFTATYRGPAANYRSAKDYSYQIAATLLTSGYDIDVCRVACGTVAQGTFTSTITIPPSEQGGEPTEVTREFVLKAKYPGSFGNNLVAGLNKVTKGTATYWNLITYIKDSVGGRTAVENLVFVFDIDNSTDSILHVSEIESSFFDFSVIGIDTDSNLEFDSKEVTLTGGTDRQADGTVASMMSDAIKLAKARYGTDSNDYIRALTAIENATNPATSASKAAAIRYMEWNYNAACDVLEILTDKLAYNTRRLIMPGWDDQNFFFLTGETVNASSVYKITTVSPLHGKMMEVAYGSRCMTAMLDIPQSIERSGVWNDDPSNQGYTQLISNYVPTGTTDSDGLFSTHSSLFAPWCQYKYTGMSRSVDAPPAFLALLMMLSMMKNQSLQYEWAQPESRRNTVNIGKPAFVVPSKDLEKWQGLDGASLNILTRIPDIGMTVWGNSTAYNVPIANYNALQNLSTRFLMNAVRDIVYRAGIGITFQYNNNEAYSQFYAAVTPLLDTMRSVGAITYYRISMSKDLNSLDSVNLNSVVGTIELYIEGIINSITVDLIALPAGTETM